MINWRKASIDRPDWVSFYERDDPKIPEILGRTMGCGGEGEGGSVSGGEGGSGGGVDVMPETNQGQVDGTIIQGVAVIKQAIVVDSPLYLQVSESVND